MWREGEGVKAKNENCLTRTREMRQARITVFRVENTKCENLCSALLWEKG